MHCGRTRTVHGFHPTKGTFMWSAPPRERAMLYILEDTVGRNDVLFPALQRLCLRGLLRLCRAYQLPRHPGRGAARIRADARRRARLLQPVHVHRRRPGRPRLHDAADHQGRRPCRPAGADGRARGAQCLRRRRDEHQQFRAEAAEADGVRRDRGGSRAGAEDADCWRASARQRTFAIRPSRPTGRCGAIPPTSPNFPTRRSGSPSCRSRCRRRSLRSSTRSSAPTSMATTTRRRCAISCSPGGRSVSCRRMRVRRRSRANDGRDLRRPARRDLRFRRALGARQVQADDRHRRAAADRAGDDRRPERTGQRRAVQLLQLPLRRSADPGARGREPSGHAVQGHRRSTSV